jgi:hypothetical protein
MLYRSAQPFALAFSALLSLALLACTPGAPVPTDDKDGPPGSGQTYSASDAVEGPCDPATAFDEALMYAPVKADIQGDWTGWTGWPVTWVFEGSTVTRYDELPASCEGAEDCTSSASGSKFTIHSGTYKLHNALLLVDWTAESSVDGLILPDLLYVTKECTQKVWFFESNATFGEVPFEKI